MARTSPTDSMNDAIFRTAMMLGAHAAMSEAERDALKEWERSHVDGSGEYGTTDWPGWDRYLPPKPQPRAPQGKAKATIPRGLRTKVFERDAYRCQHCGGHHDLRADHITPESKGGPTTLDNLQTLCASCNSRKGTTVPA